MKTREQLFEEVGYDMQKAPEHLLVDIYEELLNHPERTAEENAKHGYKRFCALIGRGILADELATKANERSAKENMALQERLHILTVKTVTLTKVAILVAVISGAPSIVQATRALIPLLHASSPSVSLPATPLQTAKQIP